MTFKLGYMKTKQ